MGAEASRRSIGPTVARFFETYLTHPKGARFGEAFVLEPWQRDFIDEAYRVDERGRRVYRQILLGIPRGNGKSPLAAGLGLFELMARRDTPDVFCAAGSDGQARVVFNDFAVPFVKGGKLATWLEPGSKAIVHKESRGVMRRLSSAGSLQHGLSVSAAIEDELHAFTTEAQEELHHALWTALHKRVDSFLMAITTAGFDLETLLGRMYRDGLELDLEEGLVIEGVGPCLRIGRDERNGVLFWWYGPPEGVTVDDAIADERIWRAVNPASWVSIEDLRKQLGGIGVDEYDFARLHLNMWTQARDVFIPAAVVKANRRKLELVRSRPVFAAVDVGLTHDTTAVGWSQPVDGGVVSRARVWSANPDHRRDKTVRHVWVPDRVDLDDVVEFLLGLHRGYGLAEVVYDPTFFEGEAQRLAKLGIPTAPLYQAGVLPQTAAQQYYIDMKEGSAFHGGDPVLERHIAGASAVKTERGWKLSKIRGGPNDAAVAVAMSHWRAGRKTGSVYEERGLLLVGPEDDDELDDDE